MKNICIFTALILIASHASAQTEIKGRIEKVTIFPSSALVEKSITTPLHKGENKIVITGNALTVGTQDIHFSASSDWFISSMYCTHEELSTKEALARMMPQAAYNQYVALKTQIDDVNLRLSNADILLNTLSQQAAALDNLKAVKNTAAFDTLVNLKEQLAFQRKELQAINTTRAKTIQEMDDLNARQRQLTIEIDALVRKHTGGKSVSDSQNDIHVTVYAAKNIPEATLTFSYHTGQVFCEYGYDVMLDEARHQALFLLKSTVSQTTGEHWNGCPVLFSTTETGYAGSDPVLNPYYLDYVSRRTESSRSLRHLPVAKTMSNTVVMAADAVEEEEVFGYNEMATLSAMSEQTLSHEYALQTSPTIPSGETPQTILLHHDTTLALFAHYATPKLQEKVLFTALLPNWEEIGLIDAHCNVYLNNRYVSMSDIATSGTGDTLRFAVGQDPNVLVSRKLVKSSPDKGGLLSKEIAETATITLTMKNTKSEQVVINLKDQVPISNASDLKVVDIATDGGILEEKTGIVRWTISLQPQEQKRLTLSYTVKYPKGKEHPVILR